jgi:Holliday junction DNA helicase RuvA
VFNSIQGIITGKENDTVRLLTSGIEWELTVPVSDSEALPPVGESGTVFTWLYHKEDGMRLFGFYSETRRDTFFELLKVDGIGPKGAVRIMGGIGQEELEQALDAEDLGRLEKVPGLGKKTAQKLILALKGRLTHIRESAPSPYTDLVEALAGMGYDRRAAAEALSKAENTIPAGTSAADKEKELFKQAILSLSIRI